MALGKDPHDALKLDRDPSNPRRKLPTPDLTKGAFADIIALMLSSKAGDSETVAKIAKLDLQGVRSARGVNAVIAVLNAE